MERCKIDYLKIHRFPYVSTFYKIQRNDIERRSNAAKIRIKSYTSFRNNRYFVKICTISATDRLIGRKFPIAKQICATYIIRNVYMCMCAS